MLGCSAGAEETDDDEVPSDRERGFGEGTMRWEAEEAVGERSSNGFVVREGVSERFVAVGVSARWGVSRRGAKVAEDAVSDDEEL